MKKFALFFLFYIACQISYTQKVPFTDQEFVLRELKMKEEKSTFHDNLLFNFKIFGKYNKAQIQAEEGKSFASYTLTFWLMDSNGDTLVSPSANSSLLQNFSFFDVDTGKYKSYSFGHSIRIPYQAFKKSGNVSFSLWARAQNHNGSIQLKPFKAGTFTANIPKTYALEKQVIKISNARVTEDTKKYNDKGIELQFSSNFNYSASELFSEKENDDKVIFYVEFMDSQGAPINISNDPQLANNNKYSSNYVQLSHIKNTVRTSQIFFPYTQFFIPEGRQEITYTIHAVSNNYSKRWTNLATGKCMIQMPAVYFAKVAVSDIHVKEQSYDVGAKDIPIINLFLSSSSSSGKGYPDLFWTFGTKQRDHISTDVIHNTFYAPNDSASFQMLEDDVLYLEVYDYDNFSGNDGLGSFTIPKMVGNTTYKATLKAGDVLDGKIILQRKTRPTTKEMALFTKQTQYNGISGYQFWGNMPKNDQSVHVKYFVRTAGGNNSSPTWQNMNDLPPNSNFSYFIPAWDFSKDAGIGMLALDTYYHLPLTQKYITPDKYISKTQDVQIGINSLQPTVKNGTEGVILSINLTYPIGLTDKTSCRFKFNVKEFSGVDLTPIIDQLKIEGAAVCPDKNCGMTIFIPYYLLQNFSDKKISVYVNSEISIKNGFIIGHSSDTITTTVPRIIHFPKTELSMDVKFAKNWSYVNISTEYNGNKKTFIKEKSDGGKITAAVEFPSEYAGDNDLVSVVITPYEFRTPLEAIRWDIPVKSLKGNLALAKNKYAKKVLLKTN